MWLLKKLMLRNCGNQLKNMNNKEIIQIPFMVCSLQENSEYLVQVSEDRQRVLIHSEITPSFFNDNHVLSAMKIIPK